jgi:hypothetical protein
MTGMGRYGVGFKKSADLSRMSNVPAMAIRGSKYALPVAGDTSYAIQEGGGSRLAQSIGGGITGGVTGFLGTVGAEKILNRVPQNIATKGTGKITALVTAKLAPKATGRMLQAGAFEGGEEGIEQFTENLVAKNTYDPERSLADGVAQSVLIGGAAGGTLRGGMEIGQRYTGPTGKQNLAQDTQKTKEVAKTVSDKNKLAQNATSNRQTAEARQAATWGKIELARQNGRPVATLQKQFERDSRAVARAKALEKAALVNRDYQIGNSLQLTNDDSFNTADTYRNEIKSRLDKEADYFFANKKAIQQSDTSRNVGSAVKGNKNAMSNTNEQMFKEYKKNPDAFIEKYNLMPPGFTAPSSKDVSQSQPTPAQLLQGKQSSTKQALSVSQDNSSIAPLEALKAEARKYGADVEFVNRKPTKKEGVHGKYRDGKIVVFTKGTDGKPRSQADIEKTLTHEIGHAFDYKRRGIVADPMGDSIRGWDGKLRPSRDSDIYFRDNRLQEAQYIRQLAPRTDSAATTQKEVYADAYRLYRTQPKDLEQAAPRIYKELDDYFKSDSTPTAKEFSESQGSAPQVGKTDANQSSNQTNTQQQQKPSLRVKQETPQAQKPVKLKLADRQTQSPANQPSMRTSAASSSTPTITTKKEIGNMLRTADEGQYGVFTDQDAGRPGESDAVATFGSSTNGKRLVSEINQSETITKAAIEAQNTGKELNYVAKMDKGGRAVSIEPIQLGSNRIEAGFVVDENGRNIGNHIKVDNSGIQVNVGGELVNIESIVGDPTKWGNKWKRSGNINRNIDENAPTKQIADNTKQWLWTNKEKNEYNYRSELDEKYASLGERIKTFESTKPKDVSKKQWKKDLAAVLDGKKTDAEIRKEYNKTSADTILKQKQEIRTLLDSVLERINAERVKYGQAPIPYRKDYLTHVSEQLNNNSFVGEIYTNIRNSFVDDGMQKTRQGVPGNITGLTENFKPISAYNKFLQRRQGDMTVEDPFEAIQAYIEPALYNIHMTETTARARAVETAFKTASEIQQTTPEQVVGEAQSLLKKYKGDNNNELVDGFSEWANTLAKKSNKIDRPWLENSGSRMVVRTSQQLQKIGGRGTILGNLSSVLAQPLNQVVGISDAGVNNYVRGVAASVGGDKAIEKSAFYQSRIARNVRPIRGTGEKVLDAGAVPLQTVEEASIKIIWNSQHAKAQSQGLKGQAAIDKADIETERLVAGRGIGDKPDYYRSVLANNLLQYTLEVNAQNKVFWNDLNVQQKATFLVAATGMNALMSAITGFTPLPDFLKAAWDTGDDLLDEEDERSALEKGVGGVQRMAGEYVTMNPILSATSNIVLDQNRRRQLFGDESGASMFEGTAAPLQTGRNIYDAGANLLKGNTTEARNSALRTVPFGNQARKTITGAETLARGFSVDRGGNKTFDAPTDPWGKTQTLLFGPSSTGKAQDYYSNKQTPKKTESSTVAITDSTTKNDSGKFESRDKYDAILNAYTKSDGELNNLLKYDEAELRNAIKEVSDEAKNVFKQAGLPTDDLDFNARIAREYASVRKSIEGKNEIEQRKKLDSFFSSTYKNTLDPTTRSFYSLGDDDMRAELLKGTITKDQMDKVIQIDDLLTSAGLQRYPQVGKTLRAELGYSVPGSTAKGGRKSSGRSGGRSRKSSFTIPSGFSLVPGGGSSAGSVANLIRNATVSYKKG